MAPSPTVWYPDTDGLYIYTNGLCRACFKSSKRFLKHVETDAAYERELVVP